MCVWLGVYENPELCCGHKWESFVKVFVSDLFLYHVLCRAAKESHHKYIYLVDRLSVLKEQFQLTKKENYWNIKK